MNDILEMEERKYIPLYVYVSNITTAHKKLLDCALMIIEEDEMGFFVSSVNEEMLHTYCGDLLPPIDSKKVYIPRFDTNSNFPYEYFIIKDGRLEELSEEVVQMGQEI